MQLRRAVPSRLDLIHRVTLQNRTETDDGHGGFDETWSTVQARIAGRIVPLSGRDLERARQIDPRAEYAVHLRYWRQHNDDLDGGRARVIWHDDGAIGDRTLEIVAPPIEAEHRVALVLTCRELR